jgi:hypothetical protein
MSPLTVANYRLDGTVMRCAEEILITGCDLLACRKHRSHIPFPRTRNDATHVNLAARQWLQSSGLFLSNRNLSVFLGNPQSICFEPSVPRSGTDKGTTAFLCNNAQ